MFWSFVLVAPDVLHRHVKSISDASAKNLHFLAPEVDTGLLKETIERICTFFFIEESEPITTAVDIFSLGMVTLEVDTCREKVMIKISGE